MKKSILLFVLVLLVLQPSCSGRKAEPMKGKPFNPSDPAVVHGEQVFMKHCQKCHPGGEGGLGTAINTMPAPQFIKRFQMRHGLGVMPAFTKKEISKKDLKDISSYLKELKKY
jgi:mono/diheme cytochrome c family protein